MQINLPPELEAYVKGKVAAGDYANLEELVKDSIRLLEHLDATAQRRTEELRREVQVGVEQLDRGETVELTDETLDEHFEKVKEEGRRRLAERRRASA